MKTLIWPKQSIRDAFEVVSVIIGSAQFWVDKLRFYASVLFNFVLRLESALHEELLS